MDSILFTVDLKSINLKIRKWPTHTHTHPQFQNVVSPHQTKNSQAGRACLRIKTRIMRRDVPMYYVGQGENQINELKNSSSRSI